MSRTARALLAWGLLATLSPGAGAQAPAESARLSVLAERIGKLHAQAASGALPERGNRAIAEAVARFDRELAQVRPHAAPEAGEQLLLLKLLWSECRPWFVRAPGRETARRVVERVEELAWVAGRAARAAPESPGVAALQGAALAQRLARLHLLRRGGPEEALGRVLDAPVLYLGVALPDDRFHAPNERMVMDQFWKGLLAAGELWHEMAHG